MLPFLVVIAVLFGACIGSFCNVVILRLHAGRGIGGRSSCPHCHKTLGLLHLIPIVSWIVLRARCAYCRKPIHWQYPVVEAVGGVIAYAALATNGLGGPVIEWASVLYTAFFLYALLIITTFDIRWQLVPVEFTLSCGFIAAVWHSLSSPLSVLLGCAATSLALAVIVWISRGRLMGEGDPMVGILIGAALGWPLGPVAVVLSFLIGGLVAVVLLLMGVVKRRTPVPFVPFLSAGAIVAYFYGDSLLAFLSYATL